MSNFVPRCPHVHQYRCTRRWGMGKICCSVVRHSLSYIPEAFRKNGELLLALGRHTPQIIKKYFVESLFWIVYLQHNQNPLERGNGQKKDHKWGAGTKAHG